MSNVRPALATVVRNPHPAIRVEERDLRAHTAKRMRTTSPSATT